MTRAIKRVEFILRHIRANKQGEYDREKAELLFNWLLEKGYVKEQ